VVASQRWTKATPLTSQKGPEARVNDEAMVLDPPTGTPSRARRSVGAVGAADTVGAAAVTATVESASVSRADRRRGATKTRSKFEPEETDD
jgi:hypothetical protein